MAPEMAGAGGSGRKQGWLRHLHPGARLKFLFTCDEVEAHLPTPLATGCCASLVWTRGRHCVRIGDATVASAGSGRPGSTLRWALPASLVATLFEGRKTDGIAPRQYLPKPSEFVLTVTPSKGGGAADAGAGIASVRLAASLDLAAHAHVASGPLHMQLVLCGKDGPAGSLQLALSARWLREPSRHGAGAQRSSSASLRAGEEDEEDDDDGSSSTSSRGSSVWSRGSSASAASADSAAVSSLSSASELAGCAPALPTTPRIAPAGHAPPTPLRKTGHAAAAGRGPTASGSTARQPPASWPSPPLSAGSSALRCSAAERSVALEQWLPLPLPFVRRCLCDERSGAGIDCAIGPLGARLAERMGATCVKAGPWQQLAEPPAMAAADTPHPHPAAAAAADAAPASALVVRRRTCELIVRLPPRPLFPAQTRVSVQQLLVGGEPEGEGQGGAGTACAACAAPGCWCSVHCVRFERSAMAADLPHGKHTTGEELWQFQAAGPSATEEEAGVWARLSFAVAFTRRPPVSEAHVRAQLLRRSEKAGRVLLEELQAAYAQGARPEPRAAPSFAAPGGRDEAGGGAAAAGHERAALAARVALLEADARAARDEARRLRAENSRLRAVVRASLNGGVAERIAALEEELAAERRERSEAEEAMCVAYGEAMRGLVRELQRTEHQAVVLSSEYAASRAHPLARGARAALRLGDAARRPD